MKIRDNKAFEVKDDCIPLWTEEQIEEFRLHTRLASHILRWQKIKNMEVTLNSYHFVWFPNPKSPFSKGETIEAYSMKEALDVFEQKHGAEPFYVTQKQK